MQSIRNRWLVPIFAGLVCGLTTLDVHAAAPHWDLAWEDDFNSFDGTKWTRVNTTSTTNNSLQAYLPQQVSTEVGNLVITATDEPYQDLPYRSGQVISRDEQRFGRWEVRAKMPTSKGQWPAIWLLPDVSKHNWPSGGEIDILENRGNQPLLTSSAFHYGTNPPYNHNFVYNEQQTAINGELENYHDSFHTYSADWTDRYIRFYVDGVHHYTVYDQDVGGFLSQNTKPMQLVINNAIGGHFLPNPDETTQWPQRMEIDYVKVYELGEGPGTVAFTNGNFEAAGGTLAGWSMFGTNTAQIQNIQPTQEAVAEGETALKLYGTFNNGSRYSGISQGMTVAEGETVTASLSSLVRSEDSLAGGANRALLKIEFYDDFGSKYGDGLLGEEEIVIADGETDNDAWLSHELSAIAPVGTVEARITLLFHQPSGDSGAVLIDEVNFAASAPVAIGDFNADGIVNAADYTVWRDSEGQTGSGLPADANNDQVVNRADFDAWAAAYSSGSPDPNAAVPEPGTIGMSVGATLLSYLFSARRATVQ